MCDCGISLAFLKSYRKSYIIVSVSLIVCLVQSDKEEKHLQISDMHTFY